MYHSVAVTMPQGRWDEVAVLMLENARNLEREGRTDLLVELWMSIIPPLLAVVSPQVRDLILEAQDAASPVVNAA